MLYNRGNTNAVKNVSNAGMNVFDKTFLLIAQILRELLSHRPPTIWTC